MNTAFHRAGIRALSILAAAAAAAVAWSIPANAGAVLSYKVLHDFCANFECGEGSTPSGDRLIRDSAGNFFGTTEFNARFNSGAIYELFPKHARYFKKVLRAFCYGPCRTGGEPFSGAIMDTAGNLYGTTSEETSCGVVYEAVLHDGKYTLKALHTFAGQPNDGCRPTVGALGYQGMDQGLPYDGTSPLYGLTNAGGGNNRGALFQLSPPKPGRKAWGEKVIYSYCQIFPGCADGHDPQTNVVVDSSGNVYATTQSALAPEIFQWSPTGPGTVVYISGSHEVFSLLRITHDGTVYGVAGSGGPTGHGTLFKAAPDGGGGFNYTDLHDFCPGGDGNCTDGDAPDTLLVDSSGNIWGTTQAGGVNAAPAGSPFTGAGVIFEYTSSGSYAAVHQFCGEANCTDGATPEQGMVTDGAGNFFGTTAFGGLSPFSPSGKSPGPPPPPGGGVLYELSMP